ncbi:fimbrial chaperone protein [Vibrio campbellii]|uniref:fimbria/pilus periplasmic chaperone n=1 Tax=Vibrio campbellii TaxID=680 RepID=UPI0009C0A371|nr:fimbria/pilus periplasmic chaperone [Vibrio campbellii]OQQ03562.1 fimbrial chaperone protein [Vibrio campbellii]
MHKLKLSLLFNSFVCLFFFMVLNLWVSTVNAAVDIDRTRIVMDEGDTEAGFMLANTGKNNVLLQMWTDTGDLSVSPAEVETPLFVVPPIFRMAPEEVKGARLLLNREDLQFDDRENLLWLNIFQVNEIADGIHASSQRIVLPLRLRLKVFVRPKGIEKPSKQAFEKIRFIHTGESVRVVNELPWYANFLAIKVGEEKFERITVEPFSSINLALEQQLTTQQVQFDILGDDGNTTNYKSTLVN